MPGFGVLSDDMENLELGKGSDSVVVYIVRHAEHIAPERAHLSRRGSLQAVSIAKVLRRQRRVSAVYSSPRSVETARNISKEIDVGVVSDERLLPYDGGRLKGWSMHKVREEFPEVYQKRFVERIPDFKVPDGESLNDRFERVKYFLSDIRRKHCGQHVVVVTHGGVIDDIFRNARSMPPQQLTGVEKPYGSLSVLVYSDGRWRVELWGAVDHLPQVVAESPTGGQLYIFPYQVAGSLPMLRSDLGELCKPASQHEIDVYEIFKKKSPAVAKFAPMYMGTVVIDVLPILSNKGKLDGVLESMRIESEMDDAAEEVLEVPSDRSEVLDGIATDSLARCNFEPNRSWSVDKLWKRFINQRRHKPVEVGNGKIVYIVMENLTHGLKRPHILDLKMGTQQHGADESQKKICSKIDKVKNTTSAALGVRVSGMQVYDEGQGKLILKDKYWGRFLKEDGLKEALKLFVSNKKGNCIRKDIVSDIILQLKDLQEVIKRMFWRFYGSSLLIVYDADPIYESDNHIFVQDINESHGINLNQRSTSVKEECYHPHALESDNTCAFPEQVECEPFSNVDSEPDTEETQFREEPIRCSCKFSRKHRVRSFSMGMNSNRKRDCSVSVKLIDFAKAEWHDRGTSHDEGFVFGLQRLMDIFHEFLRE